MILNLIVIGMVLGLAYAWMVRGFFNAFLHLLCVLISGAIAFAVWEPLAYLLVGISPERGFLSFIEGVAWGVSLILPFCISLILTRLITDKIVKANLKNTTAADYAGGAVCGLAIGVICAGILVLGVNGMRLSSKFFGYRAIWYSTDRANGAGSLVHNRAGMFVPVDRITAGLYRGLSVGSMSSGQPLARWHPQLEATAFANRISPGDGGGRNTLQPDDYRIVATYTVGSPDQTQEFSELLKYAGASTGQKFVDIRGRQPGSDGLPSKGYLIGYAIELEPTAKERGKRGGQVMLSNGQVQLLLEETSTGETIVSFPVAAISEGSEANGKLGRWRFDSNDVFVSSVGGQSKALMAFEFVVPEGYTPVALSVKQARDLLDGAPEPVVFDTWTERDRRITSGSILRAGEKSARKQRDDSKAITLNGTQTGREGATGISVTASIGEVFPSQVARSRITLTDNNEVADGQTKFLLTEIGRGQVPNSKELRVDRYLVGKNQALVQINVSAGQPLSFLSEAARLAPTDAPLVLVDSNGAEYEAVGFTYRDRELYEIRYTPGSTLSGVSDTPPISSARDDQVLTILFIVTANVSIEQFAIGDTVIAKFQPVLPTKPD